jgi:hypothetical protein
MPPPLPGNSYLPLDDGLPPGLAGRFGAVLDVELSLLPDPPLMPEEPDVPDELELPVADVPPPDALSRSHPARRAPESAREAAARIAVTFMFTSGVVVLSGRASNGPCAKVHEGRAVYR